MLFKNSNESLKNISEGSTVLLLINFIELDHYLYFDTNTCEHYFAEFQELSQIFQPLLERMILSG